jgi:hypothetical protein
MVPLRYLVLASVIVVFGTGKKLQKKSRLAESLSIFQGYYCTVNSFSHNSLQSGKADKTAIFINGLLKLQNISGFSGEPNAAQVFPKNSNSLKSGKAEKTAIFINGSSEASEYFKILR